MSDKTKFELEFLLKSSPKVLFNCISTPSGLSEWFSNDVNIRNDIYTFFWDDSEESAILLNKKNQEYMRFRWQDDEDEGDDCYFEMRLKIDPLTKEVAIIVTDFAEEDELDEAKLLWENQIDDLRRIVGG